MLSLFVLLMVFVADDVMVVAITGICVVVVDAVVDDVGVLNVTVVVADVVVDVAVVGVVAAVVAVVSVAVAVCCGWRSGWLVLLLMLL